MALVVIFGAVALADLVCSSILVAEEAAAVLQIVSSSAEVAISVRTLLALLLFDLIMKALSVLCFIY